MTKPVPVLLTVDIIVLAEAQVPDILLIRRGNDPFKGSWALPGGFVDPGEDLSEAARRELKEETGVSAVQEFIEVGAFGKPGRDPRGRTVSVAYLIIVDIIPSVSAGDDAREAMWFKVDDLPDLAFDHQQIIDRAIQKYQSL